MPAPDDNRLRICIVSSFYPPQSFDADGLYVQRLARGLARSGHAVTVVCNPAAGHLLAGGRTGDPAGDPEGVTLAPVPSRGGLAGLLAMHQSGRPVAFDGRLNRALAGPYDVIHYYNVSLMGGPGVFTRGNAAVKLGGINDHWLVCPTHLLWRWTREPCEQPRCVRCSLVHRKPPQPWRATALLAAATRHIDAFLAPSVFTVNQHLRRGLGRPVIHLPGFHAPPEPRPVDVVDCDRPYFLCTGRLEHYKGFQDVIPLMRHFPDHELVVSGEGRYRGELESLASDLPNVRVIGKLDPARLQFLYRGAVATIVPSLCYQTFCHATAESWSAGTPVIARDRSAVGEMVATHGGGLLYRDTAGLYRAISKVTAAPLMRRRLADEATRAHREQFCETIYLERYLGIAAALLALKRRNGSLEDDALGGTFTGRPVFGIEPA